MWATCSLSAAIWLSALVAALLSTALAAEPHIFGKKSDKSKKSGKKSGRNKG